MSNIEWTDKTWNPVIGCTPVSPGCLNCYAATMARRLEAMGVKEYQPRLSDTEFDAADNAETIRIAEVRGGRAVFTGEVRTLPDRLAEPLKWRKPARVFVNSMSDLFHESVPLAFQVKVFATMAVANWHTFQVLTKRPDAMARVTNAPAFWLAVAAQAYKISEDGNAGLTPAQASQLASGKGLPLPNVWLGTSVEDQHAADERIPHLLRCAAAVRFLSCEPLLGAVDLRDHLMGVDANHGNCVVCGNTIGCTCDGDGAMIDWVIVGGESGPQARPCDVAWILGIVRQCREAGVPCFVKQLGAKPVFEPFHANQPSRVGVWFEPTGGDDCDTRLIRDRKGADSAEWPEDLRVRQWPKGHDAGGGA
ncbi:MAG: phage Gp37/Gp68 family protein [Phycisphaerales bacterium]|nr:phage Gp37/Gp68 family protein [Phycisphaerales bacterium]